MPAYEYIIESASGDELARMTAILPVGERDGVMLARNGRRLTILRSSNGDELATARVMTRRRLRLRRAELPRRITISGHASDPVDPALQMQRGLYREEQRLGGDFEHFSGGMSKRELARVMAMPDAPETED